MKRSSRRASAPTRTVAQAARSASRAAPVAKHYSCWRTDVLAGRSSRTRKGVWSHNLFTTTASGYTCGYDWLAKAMGQGPSFAFASAAGAATATSGTSLTNSGATFPTAGQGLAGCIVVAGPNSSGTGSKVYGVISSNTATGLTVDQWYDPTSTTGAAGTTPNATASYVILPGQNPAAWIGLSGTNYSPATSDTALNTELTTNGFARAVATYAHTAAASTYTLSHMWTASGSATIYVEGELGAATTTAGGVFPFESTISSPPAMLSGDTITVTVTVTL